MINQDILNPLTVIFGFGRRYVHSYATLHTGMDNVLQRACPGIHVATSAAWLTVASILMVFDLCPAPGEPAPLGEFNELLLRYVHLYALFFPSMLTIIYSVPRPYQCSITHRSAAAVELVKLSYLQED